MKFTTLWYACAFSMLLIRGHAQKIENIRFENLSIQHGLSQSSVFDIHQDRLGYLWVGTMDGLDRYDGYTFKKYTYFLEDSTSLAKGWVLSLTENDKGDILLGTSAGNISWLNKKQANFEISQTSQKKP